MVSLEENVIIVESYLSLITEIGHAKNIVIYLIAGRQVKLPVRKNG